ncbi:MAG: hypothetical protein II189_01740 [Lachnospiraceae bacterium]|nr:hypothetical protein [Lachnospiraceae bacterium]
MYIQIKLNEEFVKSRFYDKVLPVDVLAEALKKSDNIKIVEKTSFVLTVRVDEKVLTPEKLGELTVSVLAKAYDLKKEEAKAAFEIFTAPDEAIEKAGEEEEETALEERSSMEEIRGLFGARQFIDLCEEIHAMAGGLIREDARDTLIARSYLMSSDSPEVLSLSLDLLAGLLREDALFPAARVVRRKVPLSSMMQMSMGKNAAENILGNNQTQDVLESFSSSIVLSSDIIVNLDISEWTERIEAPEFRQFLDSLQENTDNVIYVFSVPYLEQNVLERIAAVLGESMQIRTITFVPASLSELKSLVEEELAQMELTADESAWQTFYERIAEEKSEGRFQGIRSADRIFDEMVYARLRAAAAGIRPESRVITGEDLKDLVRSRLWNKGSEEILRSMVGFEKVEEQLREACEALTGAGEGSKALSSGIFFEGESGTGRSTAARIMAIMLREKGFLEKGLLFEHRSSDLVVPGAGMSVPSAMVICRDARGSVLFIDDIDAFLEEEEARKGVQGRDESSERDSFALEADSRDFAFKAVNVLTTFMETHPRDCLVIFAGDEKKLEKLRTRYPNLSACISRVIRFENYPAATMAGIFLQMAEKSGIMKEEGLKEDVEAYFSALDYKTLKPVGARFVRNLFEKTRSLAGLRAQLEGKEEAEILRADFRTACRERDEGMNDRARSRSRYGFGT